MKSSREDSPAEESIKIVLIGLDNSGKTSILNCLKGIKGISAFNNPMPTKGHDVQQIEALNSKYAIWDLGGQKAYLDDYFRDFKKFVKGTNKFIYVIDIQDPKRYDLALEYLKRVISSIKESKNIEFSVFLHKFDPDLVFNNELNDLVINNFILKVKETFPPKFIYSINKTTIYAIFEKTKIT
ncbi:MAG: GTP-binding protein [Promethearchaeota archaeon]|nr:MAG: GTP-binding protein [Candidatus Lokiarchaeota archaeon]